MKISTAIMLLFFPLILSAQGLNWIHEHFTADFVGFDCGTFTQAPIATPAPLLEREVNFFKLSTDKTLTNFLVQATYPGVAAQECTIAVMLKRNRKTFKMNFVFSKVVTEGDEAACVETQKYLESIFQTNYYNATHNNYDYVAIEFSPEQVAQKCSASFAAQLVFKRSN